MAQDAVLKAPGLEPLAPFTAQIYAATANAAFAERIAAALNAEGIEVVTGDFALSGAAAVIVVWSGASIGSKRLIAAAQSPLAARALVPVSLGRVDPPDGFAHLQPVDLAGWGGSADDPRWRFVIDEVRRIALKRERERARGAPAAPSAPGAMTPAGAPAGDSSFESWFDEAFAGDPGPRAAEPAAAAPQAPRPEHVLVPRARTKPLLATAAAAGVILFLAFAGLTVLRKPHAPAPSTEDPPAPHLGPAQIVDATPPAAAASPAEPPVPVAASGADRNAEWSGDGDPDRIAALIAAHSDQDAGPAAEVLDVPPAEEAPYFRDCADCPEMSRLPAGRFRMGAGPGDVVKPGEAPAVDAVIDRPFAIARTETTVAEWSRCVADAACPALPGANGPRTPAVNVSWKDASAYAAWLSARTGKRYRLPSEAEWEYAARAGAETAFAFGGALSARDAAFDGSLPFRGEAGASLRGPKPVASYPANDFGLFDMHGNAWEWTADCWGAPRGGRCSMRVLKGGAWNTGGWRLRAAHRIGKAENAREYDNGFRVVRELP
jgi:formylglycine-generating enzyme required for sulfatase activity